MTNGGGPEHGAAKQKKTPKAKRQSKAKGTRTAADLRKEAVRGKPKG